MRKMGKVITGVVVVAVLAAAGFYVWKYTDLLKSGDQAEDKVYVESVASVVSMYNGSTNRYMGVVEAQDTVNVNAASDRTLKDIVVEVGDEVSVGDTLFTYDTDEEQKAIEGYKLDLEKDEAQIAAYNTEIKEIETQRDKAVEKKTATESDLLDYTTQIQSIQLSIQEVQNSEKSTKLSIEKAQNQISNSTVTSKVDGTVKAVNDPNSAVEISYSSTDSGLIVIQTCGDYLVKGKINEQNVWTISEGQAVILRSRVNDDTWNGSISEIKTEPESNSDSSMYYSSTDSDSTSSSYPFYIALDSVDGLMLGQHVYIEMDYGQSETKEGIWLSSGYLIFDEDSMMTENPTSAEVWVRNDKDKLEKRTVTLGEYDADLDLYEVTEGLEMTDYIAANMDYLYEGVTCVTDANEVDYSSPMYSSESEDMSSGDEEYSDEYFTDETYIDDAYIDETYTDEIYTDETYTDEVYEEGTMTDDTATYSEDSEVDDSMNMDNTDMTEGTEE